MNQAADIVKYINVAEYFDDEIHIIHTIDIKYKAPKSHSKRVKRNQTIPTTAYNCKKRTKKKATTTGFSVGAGTGAPVEACINNSLKKIS